MVKRSIMLMMLRMKEEDGHGDGGEKPHEVDAGDEVKSKEDKIESCIERVDRHHHHKAQLGRNQTVENRELLKSIEEESDLSNKFFQSL